MGFVVSKILWLVLRPSTLLLILGGAGLALAWTRRRRTGLGLVTVSLGGYALVLLLPVSQWLLLPLEDRFPRPARPPAQVDGIIVLGGAVETLLAEERGTAALNGAAERMTEFVTLARRYPAARLAFTGGSGLLLGSRLSEAEVARRLFDGLGLEERRILYEDQSRTTYENAVFLKRLAAPRPGETWLLITSASHMPRSVGIFRAAGWPVVPWPVAYWSGHSLAVQYAEALGGRLSQFDWAAHEWVGLATYWLLGRTSALFPAPEPGDGSE